MAQANFKNCYPKLRRHEGGFVNHPDDPGGATNKGITQATYDWWLKLAGLPRRSVRHITDAEVAEIYREQYWNKCRADDLPWGIDYATFDGAVNSGPKRGVKWLQKAIGAGVDGVAGNETVDKARRSVERTAVIRRMCAYRLGFLQRLRTFSTFGRGWTRRVAEVEVDATQMALENLGYQPEDQSKKLSATADAANQEKKRQDKAAKATGSAGAASGVSADQLDPSFALQPELLWLVAGVLVCGALFYLYKRHVSGERLEAYRRKLHSIAETL
ncbi:Lysozyme family protein [Pseudovibrio denitrificans]|uniref:Lysozyme family protein n=1 Tax=Pseudovibrio denitrificans TaxID=258256 RepID=A0A1I6ZX31_9HYPH|nr:glycoside hydrolase family 108 protein [Pseudovibrio denitrificans]SFT67239.1 Lysozyme family protein [Pseudovibrio denitrificans]